MRPIWFLLLLGIAIAEDLGKPSIEKEESTGIHEDEEHYEFQNQGNFEVQTGPQHSKWKEALCPVDTFQSSSHQKIKMEKSNSSETNCSLLKVAKTLYYQERL